jgi:uncharacterized protein (DUF433 family)
MNERFSKDANVLHGQVRFTGTRIPVEQVIRMLENGDTMEELLREYPSLSPEDILTCLDASEKIHLEKEFRNYKKDFPHEKKSKR